MIAAGLPKFVSHRIDKEALYDTKDLYNEVGKLEHLVYKKNAENKKFNKNNDSKRENIEKKPCKICEGKNKGVRFHAESSCWFKNTDNRIKNVNNSMLEAELNDCDSKN